MRGAHRGPVGASAGKNARWLAVLALLGIRSLDVMSLIGSSRTPRTSSCRSIVLILGTAGLGGLVQGKLDMVWIGVSGRQAPPEVISDVTHHPDGVWSASSVRAALVWLGIAFVLMTKDGRTGQMWRHPGG
jgi:hypothetical protein